MNLKLIKYVNSLPPEKKLFVERLDLLLSRIEKEIKEEKKERLKAKLYMIKYWWNRIWALEIITDYNYLPTLVSIQVNIIS